MPAHPHGGLRHASPAIPRDRRHSGLAAGALTALLVVSGAPLAQASPTAGTTTTTATTTTTGTTTTAGTATTTAGTVTTTTQAATTTTQAAARPGAQVTVTLRYGMEGARVRAIQIQLGVTPHSGWFGPRTRAAVKRFQARHHLPVTGVVDARTWSELQKAKAAQARAQASRGVSREALALTPGVRALHLAPAYAGSPYRYGGSTPRGFDCSGYVRYVFGKVGVSLPRTAAAMRSAVPRIPASERRPGDLVFVRRGGQISHVAIYAGHGRWWEASRPGKPVGLHAAWTSSVSYGRVR
jgi:cell wall-associated NlpC family hydrolase